MIQLALVAVKRRCLARLDYTTNQDEGIHCIRLDKHGVSGVYRRGTQYRSTSNHHDRLEVCGISVVSQPS